MLSLHASTRRYGAVLLFALPLAGTLLVVACSASEEGSAFPGGGGPDSGTGSDTGSSFDGAFDSGATDTGAVDGATAPTTALLVQASPSLPDVRLCWATNGNGLSGGSPSCPSPATASCPAATTPAFLLRRRRLDETDATSLVGQRRHPVTPSTRRTSPASRQGSMMPSTCDCAHLRPGLQQMPPCLRYNFDLLARRDRHWRRRRGRQGQRRRAERLPPDRARPERILRPLRPHLERGAPATSTPTCSSRLDVGGDVDGALGAVQAAQLSPAMGTLEGERRRRPRVLWCTGADAAVALATLNRRGRPLRGDGLLFDAGLAGYGQLGLRGGRDRQRTAAPGTCGCRSPTRKHAGRSDRRSDAVLRAAAHVPSSPSSVTQRALMPSRR